MSTPTDQDALRPETLGEWTPDCGGDWVLSGPRWFSNYWPDNTWVASVHKGTDDEGDLTDMLADSGIRSGKSRADCQSRAEEWIRANLDRTTTSDEEQRIRADQAAKTRAEDIALLEALDTRTLGNWANLGVRSAIAALRAASAIPEDSEETQ
jgi:hypothetical protein